jgi:hypothetical protein
MIDEKNHTKNGIDQSDSVVSPLFTLKIIILSSLIIGYATWQMTEVPHPYDPPPALLSVTPKKIADLGIVPSIVKVGLRINDFNQFDIVKNEFVFSAILWFEYDPSRVSIDTLSRFAFEQGVILEKSTPETMMVGDRILVKYSIRVKMSSNLDYFLFPFDDHILYILFFIKSATVDDFIFETSSREFEVNDAIFLAGWKMYAKMSRSGYIVHEIDKLDPLKNIRQPAAEFSIYYNQSGVRNSITIILPMLVLFFTILFSFSLGKKYYANIIALSAAIISGLLAFKFVIENLSPKAGYFLASDYLFVLFLLSCFTVFFFNIFAIDAKAIYKKVFIIGLMSFVVGVFLYLWMVW